MKETPTHKKAFEAWYLNPKRNCSSIAKQLQISTTSVYKWCKHFKWKERALKRDEKEKAKTDEKVSESIADMNVRHLKLYRGLTAKGVEHLKKARIVKDRDAITALDSGIKGERVIRGEPTERVDARVEGGISFEFKIARDKKKKKKEEKE